MTVYVDHKLPIDPAVQLTLWRNVRWHDADDYTDDEPDRKETQSLADAQCVSSEIRAAPNPADVGKHYVLLDLDVPAHLIPSSTPGHSHLYIEVPVEWSTYANLLEALADAGIVERGYVEVSAKRRATFLRVPWVKKQSHLFGADL